MLLGISISTCHMRDSKALTTCDEDTKNQIWTTDSELEEPFSPLSRTGGLSVGQHAEVSKRCKIDINVPRWERD